MTRYKTVLADPPWNERGGGKIVRGAQKHYDLMGTDQIIEYMAKIPYDSDCHLYLWVTNNFLKSGLLVMEYLGFTYKTNIVWIKEGNFGLGQYFRGQHEICLFGTKGHCGYKNSVNPKRSCCTEGTVIRAPKREHSRKPDQIYLKIEKTSFPPYLEVFAREHRKGWDVMGEEAKTQIQEVLDVEMSEVQN